MATITISQYTANPTAQLSATDTLEVRGFYTNDFIASDAVTPVYGGDGVSGPYYSITPTLSGGNLVVPAHTVQPTTLSNPTARYIEQLWVNGALSQTLMPNRGVGTGWQIPTVYGDPISYDEIAYYNRAKRLVYAPSTYFTADETIREIERIAGQFAYMAVGVNGIGRIDTAPAVASEPTVVGINSPLLYNNDHLIPASNVITPQLYGAFADGAAHLITAQDITDNPQWIGTYTTAYSWDTVAVQEAIYACFANVNSTPGNVVWNATSSAGYADRPLYFPQGRYYINKQLLTVANGFDIYGSGKRSTFLIWYGATNLAMWYCDAVAYGAFAQLALSTAVETSEALLELDWTGAHTGILKNNNFSLYDMHIDGASLADFGARISKSGSSSQGDTINLLNTSFTGTMEAGLAIGFVAAQNALGINLYGGGFIACKKDGIAVTGGQVYIRGTFFGNQFGGESDTLDTQIARGGADVHVYSGAGSSGLSSLRDIRSESDVLSIGVTHLDHCALVNASIEIWAANSSYQIGQLIKGAIGAGQPGAAGRTFMMVASTNGTDYITPSAAGTTSLIIDPSASYTINEWVGYGLTLRYPNGFLVTSIIASNTATTITLATPILDYHTCSGQVCTAACGQPDQEYPCSQYRIGGVAGATEPDWDTVPAGYQGGPSGSGLGGNITQGDTTFASTSLGGLAVIGNYVMIVGAGENGGPLISRVASVNSAISVELDDAATATVSDSQFYIGAPLTDGQLQWIDIDFNAVTDARTMKAVYLNAGRVRGASSDSASTTIQSCAFARPDWMRPGEFWGGAAGVSNYPSFIFNNTVGSGDTNQALVKYNLFTGTASGYQQYAPFNMANGRFTFDTGDNGELYSSVGFGRGGGVRTADANALSLNVAGYEGTLGTYTRVGINLAGTASRLQGGLSTGNGAPGAIEWWLGTAGASGTQVNAGTKKAFLDTTGLNLSTPIIYTPVAIPSTTTVPDVRTGVLFTTANAAPTSITDFTGSTGQLIIISVGDANTTFVNGATIVTRSGSNITAANGLTYSFIKTAGGVWRQVN